METKIMDRDNMVNNMLLHLVDRYGMEQCERWQEKLQLRVKGSTWGKMRLGERLDVPSYVQLKKAMKAVLGKEAYQELKGIARNGD